MRLIDADSLICELQESKQNAFGAGWQQQIQIADALIDLLKEAPVIDLRDETIPIMTADGLFYCDACGHGISNGQEVCGYCNRIIDWNK